MWLMARGPWPLPHLVELAACSLAERLEMPYPASVDSLVDAAAWRTSVISQGAVPVGIPEQGQESGDDSDSVSDLEL